MRTLPSALALVVLALCAVAAQHTSTEDVALRKAIEDHYFKAHSTGDGEHLRGMFVDEGRLRTFIAVRIGNYSPRPPKDEILRTRWIGGDDIRSLLRRCVEADVEGFHIVYGVSAQKTAPYDLSHTRELLSWEPRQNALDG